MFKNELFSIRTLELFGEDISAEFLSWCEKKSNDHELFPICSAVRFRGALLAFLVDEYCAHSELEEIIFYVVCDIRYWTFADGVRRWYREYNVEISFHAGRMVNYKFHKF